MAILAVGLILQVFGNAHADQIQLPFWPKFPESMEVRPTELYLQHQSGVDAVARIRGEGPGFVVIAKSEKSVIFATPPRLSPAWQVDCGLIGCDLKRITQDMQVTAISSDEPLGRAAYQAALKFVTLSSGFGDGLASNSTKQSNLPPLADLRSNTKSTGNSLLQGFR